MGSYSLLFYSLGHGSIIQVVPFALATTSAVLLLILGVVVIVLPLNVSLGASFFNASGFGNGSLGFVVVTVVGNRNGKGINQQEWRYCQWILDWDGQRYGPWATMLSSDRFRAR